MPIGCHSAKMAPLTSGSTLDLSHPTVSCCILHWGFLAFCVIRQQQKKMVLTQLYVEAMCIVESLYSISESLIFFVLWQEGSWPVYFGYMLAFPALLNVTIFFLCIRYWSYSTHAPSTDFCTLYILFHVTAFESNCLLTSDPWDQRQFGVRHHHRHLRETVPGQHTSPSTVLFL